MYSAQLEIALGLIAIFSVSLFMIQFILWALLPMSVFREMFEDISCEGDISNSKEDLR